jgi:hypothetical protein
MARTKRKAVTKSLPVRTHLGLKANLDWADWLARGAAFCRTDTSKLIDESLLHYLKQRGFGEAPPPRI